MSTYYSGSLPQGSTIVYELHPEYTYVLNQSQTLCFPFKMRRNYQQLIVELANTTPFQNCFVPSVRAWPSTEASGISITSTPYQSQNTINLPPTGFKYNFWLIDEVDQNNLLPSDVNHFIIFGNQYWINVQNLQNKPSSFFCKFVYYGKNQQWTE